MVEYPLININQIDLDSLSEYLVNKNNLVYRDDAAGDKAVDVDKVAGVDAELIAVAVSKEDRGTVKNAEQLGGLPAAEYMTMTTGNGLIKEQGKLKDIQSSEIADLKDELYQLKAELLRKGAIDYCGQYAGFTDPFKRKEYVNIQDIIGTATTNGAKNKEVIIDDIICYNAFNVYDFVCIYNPQSEYFYIRQIVEKDDTRKSFILNDSIDGIKAEVLEIYKSRGIIHNSQYKFAKDADSSLGSEKYYNGLTDDAFIKAQRIYGYN